MQRAVTSTYFRDWLGEVLGYAFHRPDNRTGHLREDTSTNRLLESGNRMNLRNSHSDVVSQRSFLRQPGLASCMRHLLDICSVLFQLVGID